MLQALVKNAPLLFLIMIVSCNVLNVTGSAQGKCRSYTLTNGPRQLLVDKKYIQLAFGAMQIYALFFLQFYLTYIQVKPVYEGLFTERIIPEEHFLDFLEKTSRNISYLQRCFHIKKKNCPQITALPCSFIHLGSNKEKRYLQRLYDA